MPNLAHKLDIELYFYDEEWQGEYQIKETNIYDSARLLSKNMHENLIILIRIVKLMEVHIERKYSVMK